MTIVFVFKNGYELKVNCEEFEATTNSFTGQMTEYELKGIKDNKPIYVNMNEILCVYRVLSDKKGGTE